MRSCAKLDSASKLDFASVVLGASEFIAAS
jgi:hypothetical protein